jgi:hypothetical protein
MQKKRRIMVILLLVSAASALTLTPEVAAADGPSVEGEATKAFPASNPLVIPAAAFSTKGNDAQSHYMVWYEGYVAGTSRPGGCIQAPVYLPRFARVYQFWISYVDEDGSNDFSAWFSRTSNFEKGEMDEMGTVTTTGSNANVRSVGDTSIEHPIVVLPDHSYFVSTCLPSENTKLISARIWYAEDVLFADGFERGSGANWSEVAP